MAGEKRALTFPIMEENKCGRSAQISNGIKFTEQGSVHVQVSAPDAAHWTLAVTDTGSGIPVTQIEEQLFENLDDQSRNGIVSSKELLESYGGESSVEYKESVGSTCDITIPVR